MPFIVATARLVEESFRRQKRSYTPKKDTPSEKQAALLGKLAASQTENGMFEAIINGNVKIICSRKLKDMFEAESDEIFITRFESLAPGQGHLREAFKSVCSIAKEQEIDVLVHVDKLQLKMGESLDLTRLRKLLVKELGFQQSNMHDNQFTFHPERKTTESWARRNLI